MKKSAVITARVSEDVGIVLNEVAKRLNRSRASIVAKAVETYVAEQTAFLDFVDQGFQDIEDGNYVPHDDMMVWLRQRVADHKTAQDEQSKAA